MPNRNIRGHIPRSPVVGRTYFVDANGDNNKDGLSPGHAWSTVAKTNTFGFKQNDRLLFKRGNTWNERLQPQWAGSAAYPIIVDAWGSGVSPIINGGASNEGLDLDTGNWHDILFRNIYFQSTGHTGAYIESGYRIYMEDVEITGTYGLLAIGAGSVTHDLIFRRVYAHNCTLTGIAAGNNSYPGPTNLLFDRCQSSYNGTDHSLDQGFYIDHVQNALLYRCLADHGAAHGFQIVDDARGVVVDRSRSTLNYSKGAELYNLTNGVGNIIKSSLFDANGLAGLNISTACHGVGFYNNHIIKNATRGDSNMIFWDDLVGNVLKNNIFLMEGAVAADMGSADANLFVNNTFDYNLFYRPSSTTPIAFRGSSKTFAQYQALTGSPDPHGVSADPVFVTNYTDLHLQTTSPAKNAGVAGLGILDDYDGVIRDANPDIGCYE